ncbi:MAG: hypothetical protein CL908_15950, partial [Deltaproteobacteria bacterium]|nr:hypothetical protein [Deltaproteobacteria bacterium]
MDCQAARELFSEYLDQRLVPELRASLDGHLGRCDACRSEWTLYARVFTAISNMDHLPSQRPFRRPAEAPGSLDRRRHVSEAWSWGRIRVAAAVVVLLGITHAAVFEFARGTDQGDPREVFGPPSDRGRQVADAPRRGPVVPVNFTQRKLRDHVEAAQILARQVAYMPAGADAQTRRIVRAQLDALSPDDLFQEVDAQKHVLGLGGVGAKRYLDQWRQFSSALRLELNERRRPRLAERLRERLVRSPMVAEFEPMRLALATGRDTVGGAHFFLADAKNEPAEVELFLTANNQLLSANYLGAVDAYERFASSNPAGNLIPLSRYMQAESYYRVGLNERAIWMASQLRLRIPTPVLLRIDPVAMLYSTLHRQVDPAVLNGSAFRLQPPRQTLFFRVDQNGRGASFSFKLLTTVP